MNSREAAFRSLLRIEKESRYSNLETDLTLRKSQLSDADARLYTALVYGTLERKLTLDYILSPMVSMPMEELDREAAVLLRLGAYQILYLDRIPESAAVNESVELCKKYRKSASTLVNAVLRRLCREKGQVCFPDPGKEPVRYLSVLYSVSPDVCKLFYEQIGFEGACRLLEKMNQIPPVTLRVNTLKTSREDLCKRLVEKGIPFEKTTFSPHGVKIKSGFSDLSEMEEGLCFVQDEASQLCVEALDLRPGMQVIDCCSCPGGKSFGAAMNMENRGTVRAFDLHENKLSLVKSGGERLGIDCIEIAAADGRVYQERLDSLADRVLCDLPCSGLGVIAKKPDLRYKKEEDMAKLPEIQWQILENARRYVKIGGKLIFSTCTVLKRENEELFERFLKAFPGFAPSPLALPGDLAKGQPFLTLYPHINETDGFFISCFERKK